jgi:galactokinase
MNTPLAELRQAFEKSFGSGPGPVHRVRAPGRVNLIGEHTDYNEGFVFPMAIEPEIRFICRGRTDGRVRLLSDAFDARIVEFSLDRPIEKLPRKHPDEWTNYPRGMIAELIGAGVPVSGMDCLVSNTVPVGGGLSSSAALLVGTGVCVLSLQGLEMDRQRLALLAQKAEHEYAGAPVGIMDQTIVASARAGTAMLLDCRDLTRTFVPLDARELRVVTANSMVRHELSGGEYAQRRHQCEEAVKFFQRANPSIKALRDVSIEQVEQARGKMGDTVFRRARHVVTEIARTTAFADLLSKRRYEEAGELMVQSHISLRDDYQVSVKELDFLQEQAMTIRGVYGSRMTGGGFGGCIVALTQPRAVDPLTHHLLGAYRDQFGKTPEVFVTTATAGAGVLD